MVRVIAVATVAWMQILSATARAGPPLLIVRTYDTFGLASPELTKARSTVQVILNGASIDLVWRDCGSVGRSDPLLAPCRETVGPEEIVVRIVAAARQTSAGPLGYSLVDGRKRGGLVTIFGDRVAAMAARARADAGALLGRTIAHEVGHILLGTAHSPAGLMRAHWYDDELQRDVQTDWTLSRREAEALQRVLQRRSESREPSALAAGGRKATD